jgi:hypothetical protein
MITRLDQIQLEQIHEEIPDAESHFAQLLSLCDSDLEKAVLREIQAQELPLPVAAQKTYFLEDEPIVSADFYYEPEIYVFVDGPPHSKKAVSEDDREKRTILERHGKIILSLDFTDGNYGNLQTLITEQVAKLRDYLG